MNVGFALLNQLRLELAGWVERSPFTDRLIR